MFRREVDLESLPVLAAHVIDGHAVLPVAMILEWMAEAALHRNPGLVVCGVDDFRLFKGVILGHQKPATVELRAGKPVRRDGSSWCRSSFAARLPTARRSLTREPWSCWAIATRRPVRGWASRSCLVTRSRATRSIRPCCSTARCMQGIESVEGCGERGIAGWVSTAPATSEWIDRPLRSKWLTDPLAIDSAFQLVVLWTRAIVGANSLPTGIGGLRHFQR